ncbi:sigma factor-like helix-turn-helix DNA-binding protein [Rhodococcus opacus]|uniref:sigma factor-like helix-turn-helix DNA-binding protein n=1 Tax=Rhodococcus opacus TaxID=37919 RepID=UPI001F57CE4B|nr:sigma factor-like helix-turn-helix DNA-binding protein [Rhodococcus opacus]UNM99107.1 RNA polymerase subunit sigma-70 [Rhodococcus opacus]
MTIDDEDAAGSVTLMDTLPDRHRTVLRLRLAHRLPAVEVARILGTNVEAVLLLQHAALNLLRRHLAAGAVRGEGPAGGWH